jgi:hypothetical protein
MNKYLKFNEESKTEYIKKNPLNKENHIDGNHMNIMTYSDRRHIYFFPSVLYIKILNNQLNLSYEKVINSIEKLNLCFYLGNEISNNNLIYVFPIKFFMDYYGFTEKNETLSISLNFEFFIKKLIIYKEKFINVVIIDNFCKDNFDFDFSLDIKIVPTENFYYISMYQYLQTHNIDVENIKNKNDIEDNEHDYFIIKEELKHDGPVKGFFFGGDIDSITEVSLIINSYVRFRYDKIFLDCICTKINDKLIYLPLDINENYDYCNKKSYLSSCNLSRIDKTIFEIKLRYNSKNIDIYTLGSNFHKMDKDNLQKIVYN